MLKHKTIELFKKFDPTINNSGRFCDEYNDYVELSVLGFGISTKLKNDNKSLLLWAVIEGEYCIGDKYFDYSEEGFVAACEWLDEQREKIIEAML